ncbi:translation initiation factor eIF-2A [Wallemia mellicola]|uniref:Eukaryotic translation initiation factor 2A n=2 Tax=Wallemia mellicola TaxID=1708541 RepID=A0A4T0NC50_9BASI|nr:translation initiation factor eIF-2A [Wallemia mellicola CBS 633.66]TIB71387.1 hypothetical protein E3Q24_02328 [Wallemia mellicola]EIM22657.1 translation initiation factor eIF-2A [Wallemia mellicola CBS 633.66]TIB79666.1 translation initiation factor eIF-2A [Wallemia mellicola]TIB83794.1 translation initiation factor eIF-2A [Wallemia mellicola]TIB86820.1 translation initiation factor eIF-2A [Wallemia mellicola]|eukprot:XP_006957322.1 translation initiation factor eIF-2A [Wallemia mellicola CBS 633.66]
MQLQYGFRSLKDFKLIENYSNLFELPAEVKVFKYSSCGKYLAYALTDSVVIANSDGSQLAQLDVKQCQDLEFSRKSTYLQTWTRPVRLENNDYSENVEIFTLDGTKVFSTTVKQLESWTINFASDDKWAVKQQSNELLVYDTQNWSKGFTNKLKLEGLVTYTLSPGRNPHLATFIAEKKGAPASLRLYSLLGLSSNSKPVSQKTFFKADRVSMKWNNLGTTLLFQTQTDFDKTNKNYYGESNLYLLSTVGGGYDARITLDKPGPIHDFNWSPNSKEFIVIYGYMPAKATLFDQRGNQTFDFGVNPRNFALFNPQARFILIAGFGNLAGQVDIWDRRTLSKVCQIDCSNTSHCEWSPDGRYILTATCSPRLRVDNGVKLWHLTGKLIHIHPIEELYQVHWKPVDVKSFPEFRNEIEPAPKPHDSVKIYQKPSETKPKITGAYKPPHARGTPSSSGASTPRTRTIPGAAPSPKPPQQRKQKSQDQQQQPEPQAQNDQLTPIDKKVRNLTKKLKAIEELKEKQKRGEKLEKTQLAKLDSEQEINKEIAQLRN